MLPQSAPSTVQLGGVVGFLRQRLAATSQRAMQRAASENSGAEAVVELAQPASAKRQERNKDDTHCVRFTERLHCRTS